MLLDFFRRLFIRIIVFWIYMCVQYDDPISYFFAFSINQYGAIFGFLNAYVMSNLFIFGFLMRKNCLWVIFVSFLAHIEPNWEHSDFYNFKLDFSNAFKVSILYCFLDFFVRTECQRLFINQI